MQTVFAWIGVAAVLGSGIYGMCSIGHADWLLAGAVGAFFAACCCYVVSILAWRDFRGPWG